MILRTQKRVWRSQSSSVALKPTKEPVLKHDKNGDNADELSRRAGRNGRACPRDG